MAAAHKLQYALLVVALALLLGMATTRIASLRVAAEQLAFEHAVAALRANVTAAATRLILHRDPQALARLARGNPVALLPGPPVNYAGERAGETGVAPGHWYFDTAGRQLVYLPRFPEGFAGGRGRVALRINFRDRDGDGRFTPERDTLRGIGLATVAGTRRR
jgi:hypothetical protein